MGFKSTHFDYSKHTHTHTQTHTHTHTHTHTLSLSLHYAFYYFSSAEMKPPIKMVTNEPILGIT